MPDAHIKSFFGQNTGIIIKSTSKFKPFMFIQCIKKNRDGKWEKFTSKEGKIVKFTLEEMIMILRVLNRQILNWRSFHTYKDKKTSLSFNWEDEEVKTLWIHIGDYSKVLNFAQVEILRLLLRHLVEEKIVFSTTLKKKDLIRKDINDSELNLQIENKDEFQNQKSLIYETQNNILENIRNIKAILKGETEKAILLNFGTNKNIWIPKSAIHNQYLPRKNFNQYFFIDNWVLEKNNITM